MSSVFQAERAVSPVDGSELWVVLDAELLLHRATGSAGAPVTVQWSVNSAQSDA